MSYYQLIAQYGNLDGKKEVLDAKQMKKAWKCHYVELDNTNKRFLCRKDTFVTIKLSSIYGKIVLRNPNPRSIIFLNV